MKECKVCGLRHKWDKWNAIRANDEGWFSQLNGDIYCPQHIPDWVEKWRERNVRESD